MPNRVVGMPLLIVLAMAQFMVVLDATIVNVALPSPGCTSRQPGS
jgi:hypothetical protein